MKRTARYSPSLLLLLWSIVMMVADGVVVFASFKQARAVHYIPVPGKIVESELGRGRIVRAGANFEYNYVVNGIEYTGQRYRYDERYTAFDYSDTTNNYPDWSATTVFYNPQEPADSVLSPGVDGCDLLLLLFAAPMNIVTIALWVSRRQKNQSELAPILIWNPEGATRVRLAEISPSAAGWFALAAVAFCAAFPLVSFCGFTPPLPVMLAVWAFCSAAGAATTLYVMQRNNSGCYDLNIDTKAGAITLPATIGRQPRLKIPIGQVSGVSLIIRETQTPSGTALSYFPAVNCPDPIQLVRWGWSETRALEFATWLGNQLHVQFKGPIRQRVSRP